MASRPDPESRYLERNVAQFCKVCSLLEKLLAEPWSKDVEDQTDALICSLVAWWHHQYAGLRTQQLGDPITGLMLVPLLSEEHATQESRA